MCARDYSFLFQTNRTRVFGWCNDNHAQWAILSLFPRRACIAWHAPSNSPPSLVDHHSPSLPMWKKGSAWGPRRRGNCRLETSKSENRAIAANYLDSTRFHHPRHMALPSRRERKLNGFATWHLHVCMTPSRTRQLLDWDCLAIDSVVSPSDTFHALRI